MKPRYPESADERAARLVGSVRRMRLPGDSTESTQPALPSAESLERHIVARLTAASPSQPELAKTAAAKMAREGFATARGLIAGDIGHGDLTPETIAHVEAVIHVIGRPAWFVRHDAPQTQVSGAGQIADEFWIATMSAAQNRLRGICERVGCIMLGSETGDLQPIASGWLIGTNTIVTNAHVGKIFARQNPALAATDPRGGWRLRPDKQATIDFAHENTVNRRSRFAIDNVMYLEESENPDIAIFTIKVPDTGPSPPSPIELDLTHRPQWANTKMFVAGHPIKDLQDDENVVAVFGELDGTKRFSPGLCVSVLGSDVLAHDCSTTNGSSGSPLVDFASHKAVGLHYFGRPGDRNESVLLAAIANHPAIVKSLTANWGI